MKTKDKNLWTTQEVERYIQKMMSKSESTISELRENIKLLTIKNSKLSKDLHDIKDREKRSIKALTDATMKAKDSTKVSKMQSSISTLKFKNFAEKWINYFNTLASLTNVVQLNSAKEEFEEDSKVLLDEMVESSNLVLNGDEIIFNNKKHIDLTNSDIIITGDSNLEKITKEDEKRFNNIMKELKSNNIYATELQKESGSGFSIEEALNPTDSLDDIVKDILK